MYADRVKWPMANRTWQISKVSTAMGLSVPIAEHSMTAGVVGQGTHLAKCFGWSNPFVPVLTGWAKSYTSKWVWRTKFSSQGEYVFRCGEQLRLCSTKSIGVVHPLTAF